MIVWLEVEYWNEEKEILDSFERGEWKRVKKLKAEIKKHQEYAKKNSEEG